ncbi:MAG: PAS domain-containing sensor histidine kinase [Clostridium perfringens]|nr:PAS domain-containing sensor histidine kinase [Clostridium perfringens]
MKDVDKIYLKMIDKSPIPCILGSIIRNEDDKIKDFNIEYSNIKMMDLINSKDNSLLKAFGLSNLELLEEIFEKSEDGSEYSLDLYIPNIDKYYNITITMLENSKFSIWLTGEISLLCRCEKKCRKQEKLIEIINKKIPDKIAYKNENGIITYCNEAFARAYNTKIENIIGKLESEIKTDINVNPCEYMNQDEEVMLSKEEKIYYSKISDKKGKDIFLETVKIPFANRHNKIEGLLCITRDITSRKKLDLEFERLRTEFFANLSHEFMTPLNVIFSALQMINQTIGKCYKCKNRKYHGYIQDIDKNALRLLRLVNNLIDCTKLDTGTLDFNPQTYDIVRFVEDIFDSSVEFAKKNNINMIFDTEMEEKIISFDLNKIERVMLNLISNAIKFNNDNGEIIVLIKENKGFIEIVVRNTGIGIEESKIQRIFEKFGQVNSRLTKISEGSGIGLSLTKSLIELHGGTIEARSEVNKWTEFAIKLPNIIYEDAMLINEYTDLQNYIKGTRVEFSDIYLKQKI